MVKKGSVIVSKEDIEEKVHMNKTGESIVKYQSQKADLRPICSLGFFWILNPREKLKEDCANKVISRTAKKINH